VRRLGLDDRADYVQLGDAVWSPRSAAVAMERLLALDERPTAVVTSGDTLALGAMSACREAGLRLPADMALVSFDDPAFGDLLDPPVTALTRNDVAMGKLSASLLLHALEVDVGGPPTALYVPPRTEWWVEGEAEIAICTAPAEGRLEPRLLDAPDLLTRGSGTEERRIANILMESEEAESLLVTEVVTPAGHWSSYPPHKHDCDAPPDETLLEETYYHRLREAGGFAFQRVYTDDRSLDASVAAGDGDVVLVPRGYHPVAADARNDLYYLNVMAGPVRAWKVTVDPAYS
jgi:5-deoxy-glucuronate isomerase